MAYFPNGSCGEVLEMQCMDCPLGFGWNNVKQGTLFEDDRQPLPCPVALAQMLFNYDQTKPGAEHLRECLTVLVADDGTCQTRELLVQVREKAAAST